MNRFQEKLAQLESQARLRTLKLPCGIDLASNDYLGMRAHPHLRAAALEAIENGIALGAGGSRLLRGHCREHAALEEFAADYFGAARALYFANGYQANSAIFQALPNRHDTIIYDSLIHASAREAIQHSPAQAIKVTHNDLNDYEDALKRARTSADQIWVAVESVYSMDGDLAPLHDLQKLTQKYDAVLVIDEAHATGIFGKTGKGLSEDLNHENIVTLHTCGKAIGVAGGLVCASQEIIDTLINTARPFIYSTAPPPLQALLTLESLKILETEPWRRKRLFTLIEYCKTVFPVSEINAQIIPIVLGGDKAAIDAAAALQNAGYDIRAIRPPTVPEDSARLRLSVSINLEEDTLENISLCLSDILRKEAA